MEGVGGATRVLLTRVDELRIAETSAKNMRVRVAGERPFPGVDFILIPRPGPEPALDAVRASLVKLAAQAARKLGPKPATS